MTRWFARFAAAIALSIATAIPSAAVAEIVIKLGSFAPVNSAYHDVLLDLAEEWRQISNGEVELRIYAGGVAGDEGDMLRKMRVGQLHAATLTSGGLPEIDPAFRAFQVPMMFDTMAEFDHVLTEMRPTLDKLTEKHGYRTLGWTTVGWLYFFSREPVRVPDDLRPQRIFVWSGADRFVEAWRSGGFNPVQIPVTEVHTALQSHMIDAVSMPALAALANQYFVQVPNMSTVRWAPMLAALVLTDAGWKRVPAKYRPAFAEAAARAANRLSTVILDYSEEAITVMRENGLTVTEATAADVEAWQRATRDFFYPLVGDYIDARLVARIQGVIDAYRAGK